MKARAVVLAACLFCLCEGLALADRELSRAEVLQIFEQLTSQPRRTWIPAGTINATHEEYRAPKVTGPNEIEARIREKVRQYQNDPNKPERTESLQKMRLDAIPFNVRYRLSNEYTMSSNVVIRFDGDRFYWEINTDSRTDSIKPPGDLAGNFMSRHFDMEWNQRRIFAWDGQKYTTYFLPGNHATVNSTGSTPHVVNGSLTAGIIPWGYEVYAYDNLAAVNSSAVERYESGIAQVHLNLDMPDGATMSFVLDTAKKYAVLSCTITNHGDFFITKQYSDYQLAGGNWVPATILLERYDSQSNRLLAHDLWNITSIDANIPNIESFDVEYEPDALVEFFSDVTARPATYRYSGAVDTETLLAERLEYAASQGTRTQNCATAALKYTLAQLGRDISQDELAPLVSESGNSTSMTDMKAFAASRGLYCRAVRTDIDTLAGMSGCQAILHIPGRQHFVVLEAVDDRYVWTIDLASDRFYYSTDRAFFDMDWTQGTALLISDEPIRVDGGLAEIPAEQLAGITGGAGYSCTKLLQDYYVVFCTYIAPFFCDGWYEEHYLRWGCEAASSGSCRSTFLVRYKETPCIVHPYYPNFCTGTGEWTSYYMRACL